jgi:Flp pilus assembly protein TadG
MRRGERGQVVVLYTLALLFMFGSIGLVVDLGWAEFRQQAAQKAADAAALAAVNAAWASSASYCGAKAVCQAPTACPSTLPATPNSNFDTACIYANANGFKVGGKQNVTVAANNNTVPPPTVTGATPDYWVTVRTAESIPQLFSAALGLKTGLVAARATAATVPITVNACIWTLDPSAQKSLLNDGGGTITAPCGVVVNSNNAQAIVSNGSPQCINGPVNVVGGTLGCVPGATNIPAPLPDPLAKLPPPVFSGCDHTNFVVGSGSATLSPGVYCGGMTFNGSDPITFNAGTYILRGGGFTDSGGATYTGTGVTFYNTGDGSHPYAPFTFSGGGPVNLTAPTSGPLRNILFFQDRNISGGVPNTFSGGNTYNLSGTIYFPTTDLIISGATTPTPMNITIIVNTIHFTDSTKFSALGAAANGGTGSHPALIE